METHLIWTQYFFLYKKDPSSKLLMPQRQITSKIIHNVGVLSELTKLLCKKLALENITNCHYTPNNYYILMKASNQ